jgi:hypothetical protein
MQKQVVLVRGYCGEPVRLAAIGAAHGLIYVTSERCLEWGDSVPPSIGVPQEDVFVFDGEAYRSLRQAWEVGLPTDALWQAAGIMMWSAAPPAN